MAKISALVVCLVFLVLCAEIKIGQCEEKCCQETLFANGCTDPHCYQFCLDNCSNGKGGFCKNMHTKPNDKVKCHCHC
ncbi:hypothetical protein ACHQM5_000711 [Ranunculus cassubicifolius]